MKFLLDVNASGSLAHWIIEYVLEHYNQDLATGAIVIASTLENPHSQASR